MEIQQLRHFVAAVRCGNIGKAAEEQNITQSGLSRSILNLERQLNLTLLKRNSRGVEPTAFGLSLIPHAEAILNKTTRARKELESLSALKTGLVSIGITLNYSHYFMPEILETIVNENPGIQIEVVSGAFLELADYLERAEIDFIFGLLAPGELGPETQVEELFTARSIIVASPNHPVARKRKIHLEDLEQARWALLSGEGFQRAFSNYFYARGHSAPYQVFKTNSLKLLKHIVATGELLTILPREIVADDLKERRLKQIMTDTPADFSRAGLVYRTDGVITPAMELIMDTIRDRAKKMMD